jgi:hypothetical protein
MINDRLLTSNGADCAIERIIACCLMCARSPARQESNTIELSGIKHTVMENVLSDSITYQRTHNKSKAIHADFRVNSIQKDYYTPVLSENTNII